jgi:hypothetical protein
MRKGKSTYIVYRLNPALHEAINKDLKRLGLHRRVKSIVPCINYIIPKKEKASIHKVPMLFHYGFLRMSPKLAYNREFLKTLIEKIPAIKSIVEAPTSLHKKRGKKPRVTSRDIWDDYSKPAEISKREIQRLNALSRRAPFYSAHDLSKLKAGELITLKGYPWEGIQVLIDEIHLSDKTATIKFLQVSKNTGAKLKVPLEHIVYSAYSEYEPDYYEETYSEYLDRINEEVEEEDDYDFSDNNIDYD